MGLLVKVHPELADDYKRIGMEQLIPTTLNVQIIIKVRDAILKLNNPKLNLDIKELAIA